jgi:long-chain fatty acid transport protein
MLTRPPVSPWAATAIVLVLSAATARVAMAQSTAQIPVQFDFLNPGARSLGMGGAFIGAADDATAALANPAGLAFLNTREVSAEGRYRQIETPFLKGGRLSGVPTGIGPDTIPGPVYGTDVEHYVSPAFLSFVTPAGRVTLAAYLHESVRIENTFFSDGPFERLSFLGVTDDNNRDLPLGGTRSLTIRNYGGAIGIRLNDRLAIGGGLSAYTFDLASSFARFIFVSTVFSAVDLTKTTATATQQGNHAGFGGNAGITYAPHKSVRLGAQYRRGPRFGFTQEDRVPNDHLDLTRSGDFKVPDAAGAGIEWRLKQNFRIVADYDHIWYSQLKKDFLNIQAIASGREQQLRVDNGHEAHGGLEYVFLTVPKPLALRAGAWFDPDHAVRYQPTVANDATDVRLKASLPGGKNLVHYTFGGGIALTSRMELNAAADYSSRTTYLTASAVVRF